MTVCMLWVGRFVIIHIGILDCIVEDHPKFVVLKDGVAAQTHPGPYTYAKLMCSGFKKPAQVLHK